MTYKMTCGISGLTIKKGDKVHLFPLTYDSYFKKNKNAIVSPYLLNENTHYKLLSFPIVGLYNGEDDLIKIEKNKHTQSIEKYYGFSIEDYVKIIFCIREIKSSLSQLSKHYDKNNLTKDESYKLSTLEGSTAMFVLDEIYQDFVVNKIDRNSIETDYNIYSYNKSLRDDKPTNLEELRNSCFFVEKMIATHFDYVVRNSFDISDDLFLERLLEINQLILLMNHTNRTFMTSLGGLQHQNKKLNIELQKKKIKDLKEKQLNYYKFISENDEEGDM